MPLYLVVLRLVDYGCRAGSERVDPDNGGCVQASGRLRRNRSTTLGRDEDWYGGRTKR